MKLQRGYSIVIVVLALTSLVITMPFFLSKGLIASYDIFYHVIWSEQFHKALMEGVLYPRWMDTPFGYGSPTFIFYAPLSFYVISAIHIFITSHFLSLKIAIYLSFFLSGLSMYYFARKLNGENAGLVTAVAYQLLPFHIAELFIRGSIASLFAFIWYPIILLFMREIFIKRRASSMAYMSLAYAGLIMTHLVSAFMFTFVMIGYGLYVFFKEKKGGLLRMFIAIILGIGLASIYLIPVAFEREFVHIEIIKIFNYKDNFLFIYETLTTEIMNKIALIDAVMLIISFFLIRRKVMETKNIFFIILLATSLFLTIPLSSFIWRYMPGFSNIQFPWRWLVFSGLSVSIIAGYLIIHFKGKLKRLLIFILFVPLFLSFFIIYQPYYLADIDFWRERSVAFSPFEYRPVWLKNPKKKLHAAERVEIVKGNGSVDIIEWTSAKRLLSIKGTSSLRMRFSTFYFPGWNAYIDGVHTMIRIEEDTGATIVEVPEGKHKLTLRFEDTPVRYHAKLISLVSFFIIVLVIVVSKKTGRNLYPEKDNL